MAFPRSVSYHAMEVSPGNSCRGPVWLYRPQNPPTRKVHIFRDRDQNSLPVYPASHRLPKHFALHHITGTFGRRPCLSSKNHFLYDGFGIFRIFFQVSFQYTALKWYLQYHHFAVTQFCFCLPFKLRFRTFYRNDRRDTFPEIITFNGNLCFFKHPLLITT